MSARAYRSIGPALLCLGLVLGCSSEKDRPPGITNCSGPGCLPPIGNGGTDGGVDVTTQDAVPDAPEVADISGQIARFVDEGFEQNEVYGGWGNLQVPVSSGDDLVPFGGDAGDGYIAEDVLVGEGWFHVVPDTALLVNGIGGVFVFPTYARLAVPSGGAIDFTVPVIDENVLATIYQGLPVPTAIRQDASQIVVAFERGASRWANVSLTDWPSSEAVAYDIGVGYSTDVTSTGTLGIVIIINAQGAGAIEWETTDGSTGSTTPIHIIGQATFLKIDV